MIRPIEWKNIEIRGDMAARSILNYARLEGLWYRPDEVFTADKCGWPGDWEGRIILALTFCARATGRSPAYLADLLARMPDHLNERGYFGPVYPAGVNDEQQMSGHSWVLRGLVEYYRWKNDPRILDRIETVVNNLLIPSIGNYARYPLDPVTRNNVPEWRLSKIQSKNEKHHGTSDCGCAFIMLDGATAAYELLGDSRLRDLIDEMIGRYRMLDVESLNVQTHATLSAVRGLIRMFEITGERWHLDFAIERFALYKREAWTESYGNYNWFGIPRWTEPCCIVDSFMVAVQLSMHTGDTGYLMDAHHIYFNALAHAQRCTGAVGTDTCVGGERVLLRSHCFEVFWCCTMRMGEGYARAVQYNFMHDGNRVVVPFYNDCRATLHVPGGTVELTEKTSYPLGGSVSFTVERAAVTAPLELCFFIPCKNAATARLAVNGRPVPSRVEGDLLRADLTPVSGDRLDLTFDIGLAARGMVNHNSRREYHAWQHGPLLLGYDTTAEINLRRDTALVDEGNATYRAREFGILLRPVYNTRGYTEENGSLQVIFAPPA